MLTPLDRTILEAIAAKSAEPHFGLHASDVRFCAPDDLTFPQAVGRVNSLRSRGLIESGRYGKYQITEAGRRELVVTSNERQGELC